MVNPYPTADVPRSSITLANADESFDCGLRASALRIRTDHSLGAVIISIDGLDGELLLNPHAALALLLKLCWAVDRLEGRKP